ncbi:hypothetical protein CL684_00480 [Candidatus Campbellbacteria bacterium]|nr:hypothetical protein [Candidatus Campbellbacteria bacterium]|tara:strand:- start:1913 stop:2806 length:894 start_codon:yes stop_codon:yes gene_type:complete
MNIELVLLYGLVISFVSILGVALVRSNRRIAEFINSNLTVLTAVSAGVFLVTSFLLGRETLEILSPGNAIISFAIGLVAYIILHNILSPHRHAGVDHDHSKGSKKSAWKLLIGDAVHNIADGMLLVASFGVSPLVGSSTALSIILHETPQEISEFLVLRKSGYTTTEASYRNFGTALSIFIGIAIGLLLGQSAILQAYLLGATATFFLGIVFTDLFPLKTILKDRKNVGQMLAALVLGVLVMTGIASALGHSHEHEEGMTVIDEESNHEEEHGDEYEEQDHPEEAEEEHEEHSNHRH